MKLKSKSKVCQLLCRSANYTRFCAKHGFKCPEYKLSATEGALTHLSLRYSVFLNVNKTILFNSLIEKLLYLTLKFVYICCPQIWFWAGMASSKKSAKHMSAKKALTALREQHVTKSQRISIMV